MSDSDSELTEDMRFVWSSLTKSMPHFVKKHAPLIDGDSCGQGVFLQNVPVRRGSDRPIHVLSLRRHYTVAGASVRPRTQ
jgi:hypothetical protein